MSLSGEQFTGDQQPLSSEPLDLRSVEKRRVIGHAVDAARLSDVTQPTQHDDDNVPLFDFSDFVADPVPQELERAEKPRPTNGYQWLEMTFGTTWWNYLGIEGEYKPGEGLIVEAIVSRLELRHSAKVADPISRAREIVGYWLKGVGQSTIAKLHPEFGSVETIGMFIHNLKRRIAADNFAGERERKVTRSTGAYEKSVQDSKMAEKILTEDEVVEISLQDRWSNHLGFDEKLRQEFARFLNPAGGTIMNAETYKPVKKLIDYITTHFGSIDNKSLDLTENQQDMFREIFGAWGMPTHLKAGAPRRKTISLFLRDYDQRKYGYDQDQVLYDLAEAFEKILSADTARLAALVKR